MQSRVLLLGVSVLALAACGGGSGSLAPPSCVEATCDTFTTQVAVAQRGSGSVTFYPQSFAGAPSSSLRLPGAESFAWSFTVDTPRTFFVGEYPNTIEMFDYPYTSPDGSFTTGVDDPASITVGYTPTNATTSSEALFVANRGANQVAVYTFGSNAPSFTLGGLNAPNGIAFDPGNGPGNTDGGSLWVSEASDVVQYAYPVTAASTIVKRVSTGLSTPSGVAFDNSGTMYVTDAAQNAVVVYAPGASTPLVTVTNSLSHPVNPYVSAFGTMLYVPNLGSNSVAVFNLPLSAASTPALLNNNGMSSPSAVTVGAF